MTAAANVIRIIRNSLIGKQCYYMYHHELHSGTIYKVDLTMTDYGYVCFEVYLHNKLDIDMQVILHTETDCPTYIGSKTFGFLSKEECISYWDM